ncbi:acetoacetate decarboxylase family protein [Spongiibacter sp.]|uniref:acetoacetate decarboxylase family protein n=1 Tax=Spongiibacter sp. TaxID=2024860 RepID=UPI003563A00A
MQDTHIHASEQAVGNCNTDEVCQQRGPGHYQIDGREVSLPVRVNDASMLMNIFAVDSKVAQSLIADTGFKVVKLWPGKALMQLLAVDYRENDLGDYNEAAIVFPVTTPGESAPLPIVGALWRVLRGKLANYVYRMPVNQGFTTHAGRFIWGFPKWVTDVDIQIDEQQARARFTDDQQLVFEITAKAGGNISAGAQQAPSLAVRNGRAWKTIGITEGEGLRFSLGGALPSIGDQHPLAKTLRELGLPKKPLCSVSMKRAKLLFEGPEVVDIGQPFSRR